MSPGSRRKLRRAAPSYDRNNARVAAPIHEQLAKRHGFKTFDDLLAASFKLPGAEGDLMQSYVGKHLNGHWFVWEVSRDIPDAAKAPELPRSASGQ